MNPYSKLSLRSLCFYFMKLSYTCFGGPIALVAKMQDDLIEKRKWFAQKTFQDGMVLSQLAPGPMATQMAVYFGWAQGGNFGAAMVGFSFILPSFLIVVAISMAYIRFGSMPWIQTAFLGVGASVVALILLGSIKLTKNNLKNDKLLWGVALVSAALTVALGQEYFSVFVGSGLLVMLVRNGAPKMPKFFFSIIPALLVTGSSGAASDSMLWQILVYFTKIGAFVFGSGLVIVPFLHGGVVTQYGWLTERQFMDAVAIAMITPGPVVITVAFIGFLIAGLAGATLACFGVFFPCYLFTVIPAPTFSSWSKNKYVHDFITGITAAAIGSLCGAVIILGKKTLVSPSAILLFAGSLLVLTRFKKIPEQIVILAAAIIGMVVYPPAK